MAKYRGKYKKSRTCVNAVEVMMELVRVNGNCPHGNFKMNGDSFSNKHQCEECEAWQDATVKCSLCGKAFDTERMLNNCEGCGRKLICENCYENHECEWEGE